MNKLETRQMWKWRGVIIISLTGLRCSFLQNSLNKKKLFDCCSHKTQLWFCSVDRKRFHVFSWLDSATSRHSVRLQGVQQSVRWKWRLFSVSDREGVSYSQEQCGAAAPQGIQSGSGWMMSCCVCIRLVYWQVSHTLSVFCLSVCVCVWVCVSPSTIYRWKCKCIAKYTSFCLLFSCYIALCFIIHQI